MTDDIGHNSNVAGVDDERLRTFFQRAVACEEACRDAAEDRSELYKEAASDGFNVAALKECVKAHFLEQDQPKAKKLAQKSADATLYAGVLQLALPF